MFAIVGGALCLLLLQATLAPAQLITLRDGKVGVNFAGYHADAGLGGLLTGNAAHGGLSASAGTPWGSRAAAGLGGGVDGRTAGGAYAAAQANDNVGASALLGGSVGEHGYIGSEAHVPGKVSSHSAHLTPQHVTSGPAVGGELPPLPTSPSTYVQRVKPPKKYSLIAQNSDHSAASQINENRVKIAAVEATVDIGQTKQEPAPASAPTPVIIVKRPRLRVKRPRQRQRNVYVTRVVGGVEQEQQQDEQKETVPQVDVLAKSTPKSDAKVVQTHKYSNVGAARPQHVPTHVVSTHAQNSNVVGNALEIPIGILRSLQNSLGGLLGGQQASQQSAQPYHG